MKWLLALVASLTALCAQAQVTVFGPLNYSANYSAITTTCTWPENTTANEFGSLYVHTTSQLPQRIQGFTSSLNGVPAFNSQSSAEFIVDALDGTCGGGNDRTEFYASYDASGNFMDLSAYNNDTVFVAMAAYFPSPGANACSGEYQNGVLVDYLIGNCWGILFQWHVPDGNVGPGTNSYPAPGSPDLSLNVGATQSTLMSYPAGQFQGPCPVSADFQNNEGVPQPLHWSIEYWTGNVANTANGPVNCFFQSGSAVALNAWTVFVIAETITGTNAGQIDVYDCVISSGNTCTSGYTHNLHITGIPTIAWDTAVDGSTATSPHCCHYTHTGYYRPAMTRNEVPIYESALTVVRQESGTASQAWCQILTAAFGQSCSTYPLPSDGNQPQ